MHTLQGVEVGLISTVALVCSRLGVVPALEGVVVLKFVEGVCSR